MDPDKLESTNQLLHDLERKLSLVSSSSSTFTAASQGSVVRDPIHTGLARKNIQSSVLQYIKDNKSEFDADRVFSDRQQKHTTTFGREYSPAQPAQGSDEQHETAQFAKSRYAEDQKRAAPVSLDGNIVAQDTDEVSSLYASDDYAAYYDDEADRGDDFTYDDGFDETFEDGLEQGFEDGLCGEFEDELDDEFEDGLDENDDDLLLPPSPPRSPPREMDPNKLYGLFDFSGPDPSHCTLHRDEPVYLLNDSDNYWWLIRKMSKLERQVLWHDRGSKDEIHSDDEDGKVGFVPAECLETYGERLARLNCFKNEELERFSRETLPISDNASAESKGLDDQDTVSDVFGVTQLGGSPLHVSHESLGVGRLLRSNSILKKTGAYGSSNKSVTFENLGDIQLDDDDESYHDDVINFSDAYYTISHDDLTRNLGVEAEKHSEVLSDVYPAEAPLQISKPRVGNSKTTPDLRDFTQPRLYYSGDNTSIGSFSPDTPPSKLSKSLAYEEKGSDDDESNLRRSVILDRLNIVTLGMETDSRKSSDMSDEPSFGGSLKSRAQNLNSDGSDDERYFSNEPSRPSKNSKTSIRVYEEHAGSDDQESRKSLSAEEINTPLTSVNSLGYMSSPKSTPIVEKRRKRPVNDMFSPILGQLDELTERLAELEHTL